MFIIIFIINRLIQDFRGINSEDFILNDWKFYFILLKINLNLFYLIWIKPIIVSIISKEYWEFSEVWH